MLLRPDRVDRVVHGALHHAHVDRERRWGAAVRPRNRAERRRRDLVPVSHLAGVGPRRWCGRCADTPSAPRSAPTATVMTATDRLRDIVLLLLFAPGWVASWRPPSLPENWRDRSDGSLPFIESRSTQKVRFDEPTRRERRFGLRSIRLLILYGALARRNVAFLVPCVISTSRPRSDPHERDRRDDQQREPEAHRPARRGRWISLLSTSPATTQTKRCRHCHRHHRQRDEGTPQCDWHVRRAGMSRPLRPRRSRPSG